MTGATRDGTRAENRIRALRALWLLAVAGSLVTFVTLAVRAAVDGTFGWDEPVADAVAAIAPVSSSDVHADPFVTTVTAGVGGVTVGLTIALLVGRQLRAALFLALAIGGAVVLSRIAKAVVERPPIEGDPGDYSFPSGSATWSMATAVALLLVARTVTQRRLVGSAGIVLVLGFGWVIVWEEWHHPSDVAAGWCLAVGWVAALWLALALHRDVARPHHRQGAGVRRSSAANLRLRAHDAGRGRGTVGRKGSTGVAVEPERERE